MNRNIINPINKPGNRKISIIIPSAGYGKRMKSFGAKSLLCIDKDMSILDNQLNNIFKNFYKPQVIVVGGHDIESLREGVLRRNVTIVNNQDWEVTNVAKSIKIGLDLVIHDSVLLLYGDLVFNKHALVAPFGGSSMVLLDNAGFMKDEEVGCIAHKNVLTNMMYGLPNKWAQIAYFTNKELSLLKKVCKNEDYQNYYGFEIINKIIESGGIFSTYSPKKMKITDIDNSKDLDKVGAILCE